jgi:hypothetical protein
MWKIFLKLIRWLVDQNIKTDKNHQLDQNVKNQNLGKNVESQKLSKKTFDALIFFDAIGNTRMLKVLVHFQTKNLFDVLLWCISYGYQGLGG